MEDHDTGAGASAVGMSGALPTQSAGPHTARFSRHAGAHQRHADPRHANQRQAGASQADQHGDQPKGKTRKRRKRRRGRKVFARDDSGTLPHAAPASTAANQPRNAPPQVEPRLSVPPRPPQQELPVFAALDLGTNNCRLLVAVPGRHGQFRVIDAFSRIVRLGEGLTASGRLSQAAMDRAVEALKICGEKLRNRKIRKARLIATEACRSAANGVEFLDRVEREAGLKLEIIDRQTEARLAVSGCGSLVERDTQGVVLFDIGGGSSEIALIDLTGRRSPRLANHIVSWTSLPVGVVSLAERFGGRTVTRETFAAMVDDVATRLKVFDGRDRLAHVLASPNFHLLGTSGTVTTLAGVHLDLERYDRRRVDGLWMDRDSVDRMIERLIGWDFQQRCANPCIGADRADLVLAGCAILEAIRGVWPSERLRVADRGLREGILSELMADDGVWRGDGGRRA
ncbi:Ppx/GppA phosphatase family protein [Mesorhizobium sp. B2-8-5]|uniref:Ppx/GppA phosphatase family protein n=1 Tax=Mesorhizobium sp. B2-8-5 TaxID=2589903 RepID=UPI001128F84C|nr:Ppx/GppA phosphatase family protein [Mesorhizobium sp. B2-8-5]UCI24364.1 Ppx/GppA family phosphatase [Mesorhizobium sp. B2-8-5]